ncbi:hypothetical protein HZS_2603 [Henneguya salminicola]|nr:hypothetical protein HZS_2603 [Henneguya salminicola]
MQKYGIPAAERNSCMQFIGVLSVIPIDELEIRVAYIQQNALHESNKCPFFYSYFKTTWLTRFEPKMCNIYAISERDIRGRTNTYLDRYNRHLNEHFANAHPNLFGFIAGIQKEEFDYTMRARNIRTGSTLLQFYGDSFERSTIPNGYTT